MVTMAGSVDHMYNVCVDVHYWERYLISCTYVVCSLSTLESTKHSHSVGREGGRGGGMYERDAPFVMSHFAVCLLNGMQDHGIEQEHIS